MKLLVNEMPLVKHYCPFSEEIPMSQYDEKTKRRHSYVNYECNITKTFCDLDCGVCSGLKVLEAKE